jgi:hypothetical protein
MLVMLEAVPRPRTVKSAKTLMLGISEVSEDIVSNRKFDMSFETPVFPYILSFTCTPTRTIPPVKTLMLGVPQVTSNVPQVGAAAPAI